MTGIIEISGLRKSFGRTVAVDRLDLTVTDGEARELATAAPDEIPDDSDQAQLRRGDDVGCVQVVTACHTIEPDDLSQWRLQGRSNWPP